MQSLSNEELGLDENGFPPQDENGVDLSLIDYCLSLTPQQRLQQISSFAEFMKSALVAAEERYGPLPHLAEAPPRPER